MNFFLIAGVPNCGKSTVVKIIFDYLVSIGYQISSTHKATPGDISYILNKGTKKVLIHSASDEPGVIDDLFQVYGNNPNVDAIISTIRSPISSMAAPNVADPRGYFLNRLQPYAAGNFCIELPLNKNYAGRSFHKTILLWYHSTAASTAQHILENSPYNL